MCIRDRARREARVKMRIYAAGSLSNLVVGLLTILLITSLGQSLPRPVLASIQWLNFLSINLAVVNMMPIYPLDGYGVLSNLFARFEKGGKILTRTAGIGFFALMFGNMLMSFTKFGLISL